MTSPRVSLTLVVLAVASCVSACSAGPPRAPPPPTAVRGGTEPPTPARWLVASRSFVETRDGGIDRVVSGGRRLDVKGFEVVAAHPPEPQLDGGARLAPSATGDVRYVFWSGRTIYGASTFDGPLRRLGEVRADVQSTSPWFGASWLALSGGSALVDGAGRLTQAPFAATSALAVDANFGAAVDAFGRVRYSTDGGKTTRDVPFSGLRATGLEVRHGRIVVRFDDASRRAIDSAGVLVEPPAVDPPAQDDEPPELWPAGRRAALGALTEGIPLDDRGAVIAAGGFVGRLDVASLRATSVAELPGLEDDAQCAPFRATDALLVLCVGPTRAAVFDVGGTLRVEKTFSVESEERDRFVGSDENGALGFVGACAPGGDAPRPTTEGERIWPSGSSVFCARVGGGAWVEHHFDAAEAREGLAWIPRPGGDAALLLVPGDGAFSKHVVEQRGALLVVRLARNAPPAILPDYASNGASVLKRAFTVLADGSIVGWMPASEAPSVQSVVIDPRGRVSVRPLPPRTVRLGSAGPRAIATTDDGAWHQTVDRGLTWTATAAPPAAVASYPACGPMGCAVGAFTRIGWDAAPRATDKPEPWRALPENRGRRRAPPAAPIAEITCHAAGPPEGIRQNDTFGFGVTKAPIPREHVVPIGHAGVAMFPSGSKLLGGDVELGWLQPLDVAGRVRRAKMPLARAGVAGDDIPYLGLSVAPVLRADGGVDLAPARHGEVCLDAFLEAAGVVRPGLGCVEAQTLGVEIGATTWFVHPGYGTSSILARPGPAARGPGSGHWVETTGPGTHGRLLGVGARAGAAVMVLVDVDGAAMLAPLDANGKLGADEPLASLASLALAPACGGGRGDAEAIVLLAVDNTLAIRVPSMAGVSPSAGPGLAVVRWSRERACLEAFELPVRDERVDIEPASHDGASTQRRVIASLGGRGRAAAALIDVGPGLEVRQPLVCDGAARVR